MALFLGLVAFGASALVFGSASGLRGDFGGPAAALRSSGASDLNRLALITSNAGVLGQTPRHTSYSYNSAAKNPLYVAALYDYIRPSASGAVRAGIITYSVKKGDTLSGIALKFGISLQTVINANPDVRGRSLQIDQELKILPASGVVYEVQEEDTLESISEFFSVRPSYITEANRSVDFALLQPGTSIVVPGVQSLSYLGRRSTLPDLGNYFIEPASGHNWGQVHTYNAVDIANNCGTKVVASAEGLVIPDEAYGDGVSGWNNGYGRFVLIEHPNGTRTRYAHLSDVSSSIGDYVKQGQEIATIGNSGNVHGPTGCHLHFEVYGAQNPLAR